MLTCDACSKEASFCQCHMRDQRVWGYLDHFVKQAEGMLLPSAIDGRCRMADVHKNWRGEPIPRSGICTVAWHYRVTDGMERGDTGCPVIHLRIGKHNMAYRRIDVWFKGPDGFVWWGVDCGNGPRCRRTKESWVARVFARATGREVA